MEEIRLTAESDDRIGMMRGRMTSRCSSRFSRPVFVGMKKGICLFQCNCSARKGLSRGLDRVRQSVKMDFLIGTERYGRTRPSSCRCGNMSVMGCSQLWSTATILSLYKEVLARHHAGRRNGMCRNLGGSYKEITRKDQHIPPFLYTPNMIFTASQMAGQQRQHPSFTNRGISGLTQSSISDLDLFCFPHAKQLAYDGYKNNLSSFICATALQRKVATTVIGQAFQLPFEKIFIPALPPVAFSMKTKMTDVEKTRFISEYAENGVTADTSGKELIFVMRKPTLGSIRKIARLVDSPTKCPVGSANLDGLYGVITVWKLFTAFLS